MKRFIIISLIIISLFALAGATEEKSFSKSYMSEQSLSTKSTYSFVKSEPKSIKSDKKSITTKKSYKKVQKPTKTTSVKRIRKALMKAAKNKEPISLTPKKETKPIMFNAKKGEKASLKSSPIPKPDFTCNVDEDHIHLSNTPRPLPRYVCFQNSRLHERVCAEEWQGYEFEFVERCRFGCHNGACVEAECRDSDANFIFENGNNIFEQGTIEGVTDDEDLEQIIENHDNIEYCVNESTIAEMFCENDVITMEEFACSEGTVCRNGACTIECTDSDNSTDQLWGPDSRIQGSTRGVLRGEFVTVEDECTEDGLLVEYTCLNDGMSIGVAANSCDIGLECNNGACIPEPEECTNDFANYPCFFENNSEFNGFAVIGRNATLSERYAASIIFTGMEEYYHIEVPPQSIRYDYNFSVETSPNMISIGSGCVNRHTHKIRQAWPDCTENLRAGTFRIQLFPNETSGNMSMTVEGFNGRDLQIAGELLANLSQHQPDAHGVLGICEGDNVFNTQCQWYDNMACEDVLRQRDFTVLRKTLFEYWGADVSADRNPTITLYDSFQRRAYELPVTFAHDGSASFRLGLQESEFTFRNASRTDQRHWEIQRVC